MPALKAGPAILILSVLVLFPIVLLAVVPASAGAVSSAAPIGASASSLTATWDDLASVLGPEVQQVTYRGGDASPWDPSAFPGLPRHGLVDAHQDEFSSSNGTIVTWVAVYTRPADALAASATVFAAVRCGRLISLHEDSNCSMSAKTLETSDPKAHVLSQSPLGSFAAFRLENIVEYLRLGGGLPLDAAKISDLEQRRVGNAPRSRRQAATFAGVGLGRAIAILGAVLGGLWVVCSSAIAFNVYSCAEVISGGPADLARWVTTIVRWASAIIAVMAPLVLARAASLTG
jgi:hypothetical protein